MLASARAATVLALCVVLAGCAGQAGGAGDAAPVPDPAPAPSVGSGPAPGSPPGTTAPGTGTAAAPVAGPAACPPTYLYESRPQPTRQGALVPTGATSALLCRYPFPMRSEGPYPLGPVVPLPAGVVPRLVELLNDLPDAGPVSDAACLLMGRDEYQIALGYPGDRHTIVKLSLNCGTAASTGAVRQLGSSTAILSLWARR